ncbi:acyl-CoA/acyl-ACP dehydrogenase [Nocardioides sp. BP30]|uniref:acyl-CoA dehydrogenase family protein n=1 Tax=Nocardioides sp. BP30 TaxID=3036374 RepID=UPI002469777C|nr:acyl-CoA dehydrogenase family protein [Nocardioides sp. BP30]WGL54031.1 acyl-CoA/acyl-ACP dehydrogenase [Nocardioides sp. BP30]
MISGPTQEHEELRELTRRFLADKSSLAQVRQLAEAGATRDDAVWAQMAEQLMLQGIAIPEEYGGAGFGPVELGVVLEEMGRALVVAPYFSTVALAGQTLTACRDEQARSAWLPGIAAGALTATLAVADRTGEIDPAGVETTATRAEDGWRLAGTKRFVIDGATADLIIVAATVDDDLALFTVEGDAAGLRRELLATVDATRQLATVTFEDAPAVRIEDDAEAVLARVADLSAAALAAEQAGGAAAALEMAVEYARIRVQFGRPIGSFQAIKHRCADLLLEVESARNAAFAAASLLAQDDAEGPVAAALAAAWCATAYTHAAKENIQFHGGIGFTWEHDAHFFLKRAKTSELLLGTPARHRARVADLVGI